MATFTFVSLYTDETSNVRTIALRGNLSSRSASKLSRWMDKHPGSAIVEILEISHCATLPEAQDVSNFWAKPL